MQIANSNVAMSASSSYAKTTAISTSVITAYHGDGFTNSSSSVSTAITSENRSMSSILLDSFTGKNRETSNTDLYEGQTTTEEEHEPTAFSSAGDHITNLNNMFFSLKDIASDDPKLTALKAMLELLNKLTGNRNRYRDLYSLDSFKKKSFAVNASSSTLSIKQQPTQNETPSTTGHWTQQVNITSEESGTEAYCFTTTGTANTADGRSINFNVTMGMSRSFASAVSITGEEKAYVVTDPLVINLKNPSAEVTDIHFMFDLNNDGKEEQISQLKSGSGFLALDKNKDGKINNGSELFGAETGDGFGELAEYDEDKNGWIDENDSVFQALSVWQRDESGNDSLVAISKAGVGAIYLGSAKADYTLTDSAGKTQAYIKSSGVFLNENGSSGTIQHIDFKA